MLTFLIIWIVMALAMLVSSAILTCGRCYERRNFGQLVVLCAFWPPIFIGLAVSFLFWCVRKEIESLKPAVDN